MTPDLAQRSTGLVLLAVLVLAPDSGIRAQESPWSFGVQLGAVIPTGDLADLEEPGPALEAGGAFALSPRLGVRADGGLDFLLADDRLDSGLPDLRLWHYTAGLEALVTPPRAGWTLRIAAGGGITYAESDSYPSGGADGTSSEEFGETYPSLAGALRAGWSPGARVELVAGVGARIVYFDEDETLALARLATPTPTLAEGFGATTTVPIHLRVRVRL